MALEGVIWILIAFGGVKFNAMNLDKMVKIEMDKIDFFFNFAILEFDNFDLTKVCMNLPECDEILIRLLRHLTSLLVTLESSFFVCAAPTGDQLFR